MDKYDVAEQLDGIADDLRDAGIVLGADINSQEFNKSARRLALATMGYVRLGLLRTALQAKREAEEEVVADD